MWDNYPKHLLELQREIPSMMVEPDEPVEIKEKKVKPHLLTKYARKKFPIPSYNKSF